MNPIKRSAPAEKIGDGEAEPCPEGAEKAFLKEHRPVNHAEPMTNALQDLRLHLSSAANDGFMNRSG